MPSIPSLVALRPHRGFCLSLPPTLFDPLAKDCVFGSGSVESVCIWASLTRILPSLNKKSKKNVDFYCFGLVHDFLSFKTDVNVPSKNKEQKTKNFFGSGKLLTNL